MSRSEPIKEIAALMTPVPSNCLPLAVDCALLAKFADSVDLKDGLLNNRVCTVKFPVVESYFSCNTTHTV